MRTSRFVMEDPVTGEPEPVADFMTMYSWALYKSLGHMIQLDETVWPIANNACDSNGESKWCAIEAWSTLVSLYIGTCFYALLISQVSSIILGWDVGRRRFREKLEQVNEYMRAKKLPGEMRDKVRGFYSVQFAEGRMYDENEIMKELTPGLRRDILFYNSRMLFEEVPVLCNTPEFAKAVAPHLVPWVNFKEEVVFEEDRAGEDLYFIYSGIIELQSKHCNNATVITIGDGCYFGDVAVLKGCKRTATARCKTLCIMYSLTRSVLLRMLADFEDTRLHMHKIAEGRKRRMDTLDPSSTETVESLPKDMVHDREDAETDLFRAEDALIARLLGVTQRDKNTREVFGKALLTSQVINNMKGKHEGLGMGTLLSMGSEAQQSLTNKYKSKTRDPWLSMAHGKSAATQISQIRQSSTAGLSADMMSAARASKIPNLGTIKEPEAASPKSSRRESRILPTGQ
jgi:CRP-like cAMP-binding protein